MKTVHLYNPFKPDKKNVRRFSFAAKTWRHLYDNGVIPAPVALEELSRSSKDVGDERELPFIKDMIELCIERHNPDIIIFTNSDICFTSDIARKIDEKISSCGLCFSQRFNFDFIDKEIAPENLATGSRALHGYDLFVFSPSWYESVKYLIPDYILGGDVWDMNMGALMYIKDQNSELEGVIYHENHPYPECSEHAYLNKGRLHNLSINAAKYSRIRLVRLLIESSKGRDVSGDIRYELYNLNRLGLTGYELFELL
jgi:hypothetical protein